MQINRISNSPIKKRQAPQPNFKGQIFAHFSLPLAERAPDRLIYTKCYQLTDNFMPSLMRGNGAKQDIQTVFTKDRIHKFIFLDFPKGTDAQEKSALDHLRELANEYPDLSKIISKPMENFI